MLALQHSVGSCKLSRPLTCSSAPRLGHRFAATSSELRVLQGWNRTARQPRHSTAANALFGTKRLGIGSSEVYVTGEQPIAGARGQIALRIIKQLLGAGRKVSAIVPDEEEAQGVLEFAKKYKLISAQEAKALKLVEVDPEDQDGLTSLIARAGTVVAVAGDSLPYKADPKALTTVLAAAQEGSVGRIILVVPQGGGGGGGGFLGGLFGGRSANPETAVIGSGLSYAILRTGKPNLDAEGTELGQLALGAQGSRPQQAAISPDQIAEAVAALVQQAQQNVVVEAWAASDAPASPAAELLSGVLASAAVDEDEQAGAEAEQPEEVTKPPPAKRGRRGSSAAQPENGSSEAQEDSPPKGLFGAFNQKRVSPQDAQDSAAKGLEASGKQAFQQAKARTAGRAPGEEAGPEQKAPGFLQRLGLGQPQDLDES